MKQIKHYVGDRVEIDMKTGNIIEGALAFFNWEQQIVHLSDYIEFDTKRKEVVNKGKFIVVNQREWSTFRVKE